MQLKIWMDANWSRIPDDPAEEWSAGQLVAIKDFKVRQRGDWLTDTVAKADWLERNK